jgi:hypothetical protein
MFAWMQKKLPKFIRTAKIGYTEKGTRALFVSNAQENLRTADLRAGEQLAEYYARLKLEGNVYSFWSPRGLKKLEQLYGQLSLIEELPSLANYAYPYYCQRDERNAEWHYETNYKGVGHITYGETHTPPIHIQHQKPHTPDH